jgi:pimeloyl-ACP methyl ester carboxylesterase
VAYDRAGLGQSEWDETTPTPRHVATRLHALLAAVGAGPPYVVVGYSWGGSLARYFAGYYPDEIAGIVFVDPGPIVTMTHAERLAPYDSIGAGKPGYDAFWSAFDAFFAGAGPAVRAEFEVFRGMMEIDPAQRDLRPLPRVPMAMLVAGRHVPFPESVRLPFDARAHFEVDVRHRARMLQRWIDQSPRGTLVVSNHVSHAIPREDPALIVWAIERVLGRR